MQLLEADSVRTFLSAELSRRVKVNPRYSQRAFARNLGLSPGELSEVLRGRRNLSLKSALRIAKSMGLNSTETKHLVHLAQVERSRKLGDAELLESEAQALLPSQLSEDAFHVVSDWFYFAILNLIDCHDFQWNSTLVARRLGLTKTQAQLAMERLSRMGLVQKINGRFVDASSYTSSPLLGCPSDAVRSYHRQLLSKALYALEVQSVMEREFRGIGFAVDPEDLPAIKKDISEFQDKLAAKYSKTKGKKSEVYHLEMALFKLTQGATNEQ